MATKKEGQESQEEISNKEKILELEKEMEEQRIASRKTRLENIQIERNSVNIQDESLNKQKRLLELQLEELKLREQLTGEQEKELKTKIKVKNLEIDLSNDLSSQAKSMLGINGNASSLLGKMVQISGEGGNLSAVFADTAKEIARSLSFSRLLASAIDTMVSQTKKLFTDMDQSFSQFEKTAGGVDAFKGRILELRDKNVEYTVSIQDASKAFSDLKTQFAGFAGLTESTQNALANTTAQMEKLGVSSSETIKIQNMLVKGFQMTGEEAGDVQKQLMATAKSMGLPMQQVVKEFANAAPALKAQGANMQKVFLDLQNQSKNLGIEFTRLQDITGKFDTFDGAADAAGNLNAILGGDYLNSIQMLNADEGERIRLMQDALKASGKSFEAMSKQERMAVANSLGLKDATELQQMMNNATEEGTVEALNKAQAEKEMAQSIKDVTTLQEKLTAIMAQFAVVLTPVLDLLKDILTPIGEFLSKHPDFTKGIMAIVSAFGALYILGSIVKGFAEFKNTLVTGYNAIKDFIKGIVQKLPFMKAEQKATEGIADAQKKLNEEGKKADGGKKSADTIKNIGEAAKNSWREILAFGAAMLMIGAGIGLAALGLAELVKAFQGLTGEQVLGALGALIIVMGGFALMLYILTGAALPAALPMLALGAAFLMIGAGIAIAALGLAQFVKSFKGLENAGTVVMALAVAMGGFALIVWILAPALTAFAASTTIAGGAAMAAAGPLMALGFAFLMIGAGIAVASVGIGYIIKNIVDLFQALNKANPSNISASFAAIFDSITLTGLGKFAAFSKSADGLTSSLAKLAISLTAVASGMKAVSAIDAVFNPASANSTKTASTSAPAAANTNASGGSSTNVVPVAIYIDSKKIGEILDPRYKKMIDDKLNNIGTRTVPI